MLTWEKKGLIFDPKLISLDYSHAQIPYGFVLNNILRVFFTSRPPIEPDGNYTSLIFYADFDINNLRVIKHIEKKSLLEIGEIGAFDEFGTMPGSVIKNNNNLWLFYAGWTRLKSVPFSWSIGLAICKDQGNSFKKFSEGPIMGINHENPYLLGCPRVYVFNNKFYMWFISGTGWIKDKDNRIEAKYNIKLAISDNGIDWRTINHNPVPYKYNDECQTSVTVFKLENLYHMYFTYRHTLYFRNSERGYKIGYAYSQNLLNWIRDDNLGNFEPSSSGWDSEMICYPSVTLIEGIPTMLYCGNSFGKYGFGYAKLKI